MVLDVSTTEQMLQNKEKIVEKTETQVGFTELSKLYMRICKTYVT